MRKYILFIVFFSALIACDEKKTEEFNRIDLTIDLKKQVQMSDFFSKVVYIPLERTKACNIGYIKKVEEYNNNLYVLDAFYAKGLFVFSREGHFIRRIGSIGKGKGEYRLIRDFMVSDDKIYLLSDSKKVCIYKITGEHIRDVFLKGFRSNSFYKKGDVFIFLRQGKRNYNNSGRVIVTDLDFNIKEEFFKYPLEDPSTNGVRLNFEMEDEMLSYIPLCDTLYSFGVGGVAIPKIELVVPSDCHITANDISQIRKNVPNRDQSYKILAKSLFLINYIDGQSMKFVDCTIRGERCYFFSNSTNVALCTSNELVNDVDKISIIPNFYKYCQKSKSIIGVLDPSKLFNKDVMIESESFIKKLDITPMDNPIIALYEVRNDL